VTLAVGGDNYFC